MEITHIQLSEVKDSGITETSLLSCLPLTGRERIMTKLNPENRLRSLLGELLARYTICRHYNLKNNQLTFSYSEKGKPSLDTYPHIHFNISHSGQKIACVLAEHRVGIDIEYFRNVNLQVAKRFFSVAEVNNLLNTPAPGQLDYFFKLWTMKESFLKALGSGFTRTLNSFSVVPGPSGFHIMEENSRSGFRVKSWVLPGEYYLAVCCEHIPEQIKIQSVNIEEMMLILAT